MNQVPDHRLTSEEEYRNIFEAASDGLIIYDMGTDLVVEANPAACEMHGYTHQEFMGPSGAFCFVRDSAKYMSCVESKCPSNHKNAGTCATMKED